MYYVYKRHGVLDYLIRQDLGESFVDQGFDVPGAVWVRLDGPYLSSSDAVRGMEQCRAEGVAALKADSYREAEAATLERAAQLCQALVGKQPAWDNDDVCLHLAYVIRALATEKE